jgi:hypothetical protein
MTSAQLFRISGFALLAGSIAFVVHVVLRSVVTAGPDPAAFAKEGLWIPINAVGVVGAVLVLLGLPAAYARMAGAAGLSGMIGVALLAAAWMFFGLFLSLYSVLVLPWLADQAPSLVAASAPLPAAFVIAFIAALLAWFVGAMLLATPFIRRRVQPSWVGYALPLSAVWVVIGNLVIAPSGPASNLAVNLLSNMGPVLLLVGIGYLGYRMWAEHATALGNSRGRPSA